MKDLELQPLDLFEKLENMKIETGNEYIIVNAILQLKDILYALDKKCATTLPNFIKTTVQQAFLDFKRSNDNDKN